MVLGVVLVSAHAMQSLWPLVHRPISEIVDEPQVVVRRVQRGDTTTHHQRDHRPVKGWRRL
eukprot:2068557-Prymnesium_polylepis.1